MQCEYFVTESLLQPLPCSTKRDSLTGTAHLRLSSKFSSNFPETGHSEAGSERKGTFIIKRTVARATVSSVLFTISSFPFLLQQSRVSQAYKYLDRHLTRKTVSREVCIFCYFCKISLLPELNRLTGRNACKEWF